MARRSQRGSGTGPTPRSRKIDVLNPTRGGYPRPAPVHLEHLGCRVLWAFGEENPTRPREDAARIDRSRRGEATAVLGPDQLLDLGKLMFPILRGADTPTQRRYTWGTWDVVFCGVLARRTPRGPARMPHGWRDLGEEKPTRPRDRTNSSIWENRCSQSYEGRKPPPTPVHLGDLGCRVLREIKLPTITPSNPTFQLQ